MSWADNYVTKLKLGESVSFRPRGDSMVPKIYSGQRVHLVPVGADTLLVPGDIVLCRVAGAQYLHMIKTMDGVRYQITNARGKINGWTTRDKIYGRVIEIEENRR